MGYIEVDHLVKEYGQGEAAFVAVKGMSFEINQGEFAVIMGESGSGKSTLLTMMGALNLPTTGTYTVDDIDIYALGRDQRAEFRREYLGFIFQSFYLIPYLTVLENVMLPLAIKKMKNREKRELARSAMSQVGLEGKENRLPGEISGGEQERVAVARAIVNEPTILLADEPTGNLDTKTSRSIMDLFQTLNNDGMTIVMVTHSHDSARYARRILRVADGLLVGEDRLLKEVSTSPGPSPCSEADEIKKAASKS
ncbi:MAG: ABC transporter ATP-binding protein [Deltaproteobacteria bacterium]|nr:ABC transporter ATP-binding protein [Deltaproteobacteria bacterium]